jgi:hypothetical protein
MMLVRASEEESQSTNHASICHACSIKGINNKNSNLSNPSRPVHITPSHIRTAQATTRSNPQTLISFLATPHLPLPTLAPLETPSTHRLHAQQHISQYPNSPSEYPELRLRPKGIKGSQTSTVFILTRHEGKSKVHSICLDRRRLICSSKKRILWIDMIGNLSAEGLISQIIRIVMQRVCEESDSLA